MAQIDHIEGLIKFVREAVLDKDDDQNPGLADCVEAAAQQHAALLAAAKTLIEKGIAAISVTDWNALRNAVAASTTTTAPEIPGVPVAPEEQEFGDGPRKYEVKLKRSTTHAEIAWVTIHAEDEDEAGEIALEHEHEVEWETDDAMDDLYNADAEVDEVEEAQ